MYINQAAWDNLSPSVRLQDVKVQKVQTSLFKGICALTCMINTLIKQIVSLPVGSELLQEATDTFALLANANTELNQRCGELIKLDSIMIICTNTPHPSQSWINCLGMIYQSR